MSIVSVRPANMFGDGGAGGGPSQDAGAQERRRDSCCGLFCAARVLLPIDEKVSLQIGSNFLAKHLLSRVLHRSL